jgi:tryptophan halogenase
MKILIVGGGTAGYVTALILKQALDAQIDMVHSSKIGIIGVGEGSTEHFYHFMRFIDLNHLDFIRETDATLKAGVMFRDWTTHPYLHTVGGVYPETVRGYHHIYGALVSDGDPWMSGPFVWNNVIPEWSVHPHGEPPFNQFHFNTYKLNTFLDAEAKRRGVTVTDAEVVGVEVGPGQKIHKVHTTAGLYENYDLYIDATGNGRVLIKTVGAHWISYSPYLHMNSAFVFPTPDTDNYNMWTLAQAMESGWMFTIPVWGRHGNGYVYNSAYTDFDAALKEVELFRGGTVDVGKQFSFDPGRLREAWVGNCVAVGLAGSFVEPMEASSIGTTIQQAFMLANLLPEQSPPNREAFNKSFASVMDNIRDFVALHYIVDRTDTPWWKDLRREAVLPNSLAERLKVWKHRLPVAEDFAGDSRYILFDDRNFTVVLNGLGLLDQHSIRKQFASRNPDVRRRAEEVIRRQRAFESTTAVVTHKDYLHRVRTASPTRQTTPV